MKQESLSPNLQDAINEKAQFMCVRDAATILMRGNLLILSLTCLSSLSATAADADSRESQQRVVRGAQSGGQGADIKALVPLMLQHEMA